ncbi:MAG TPA: hypothetical protein VGD17_15400 [Chitinophagaceae bacterium]
MKNILCFITTALLFCTLENSALAQAKKPLPLTADSLATGNYKDVFKSFFQVALDRLTSNNKDIQFTSNPFAIMARADTSLLIDTSYLKYKALRNLNFAFSAKLDSSYKFNGFSSGITYAIINRRDITVSQYFLSEAYRANDEFNKVFPHLTAFVTGITDADKKIKLNDQLNAFFFDSTTSFKDLDPDLQNAIREKAKVVQANHLLTLIKNDPKLKLAKLIRANYDSVRTNFQNRLLLTAGISDTTYKDKFMFSNVVLTTNLVKGFTRQPNRVVGLELNIKGAYQFLDDTLTGGRDLKRQALNFESGINMVIKTRRTQYPWAEFKLSGNYTYINKPYASERRDSVTINGTLRIRILDDIWIPIEIKYDPKSGNVFGFLNIRANLKGIKKGAFGGSQ